MRAAIARDLRAFPAPGTRPARDTGDSPLPI